MRKNNGRFPHPFDVGAVDETLHRKLFGAMGECFSVCVLVRDDQGRVSDYRALGAVPELSPVHDERLLEICARVVESGEPTRQEQYIEKSGRWLSIRLYPLGEDHFAEIFNDITERRREKDALIFQAKLLANVHDAVVATDENFNITYWNKEAESMFGWTEAEALDGRSTNVLRSMISGPMEEAVEYLREGKDYDAELILRHKDGHVVYSHTRTAALRGPNGEFMGTISAIRDMTERRKAEEALTKSNSELQQYAFITSHDLKEPLRMVTSYLGLLENRYSGKVLDGTAKEYIHFAVDGAERMRQMIDDLLSYTSLEAENGSFEHVEMDDALAMALREIENVIIVSGASITHDPLPCVMADRMQMIQLLENLIGNSIKFCSEEAPHIHISATSGEGDWIFSVQDNGIGIDPKYGDHLFGIFNRLHTRIEYKGTGIGLAIAKKIVERHGGKIWFESEPGKGTTFFFTILV
jgi:PAS domain S-box-containing protein